VSRGAAPDVPTGNVLDKRGSVHPVVRRLVGRFDAALDELLDRAAPSSILDAGCGEGELAVRWAARPEVERVLGVDLDDPALRGHWRRRERPGLAFAAARAEALPAVAGAWDLVAAVELLEHVADPDRVLSELARVARRHLLVSVPREPLWRALNLARGAYVRRLGNTPGHVGHFSRRRILTILARYGTVVETRAPLPWTMALVRV
jgi:2-polyprenyl-3-methyl-5-hydroxy-6-metoxy-1,4-benzoquinol methylase